MSNIVVDTDELGNEIEEPVAEPVEEVVAEEPKAEAAPAQRSRYDDWDKDIAVKNYQELEKLNSRQAQELGALRKMVESVQNQSSQQPTEIDVDSLLDNPKEALDKTIAQNPEVQQLKETLTRLQQTEAVTQIRSNHPDYMDIISTPDYQNWVLESPVRQDLHYRANNYDVDAANELLTVFKERQQYLKTSQVKEEVESKRREDLAAASSEGASSGSTSAKIYRKHDLIRLNMTDPEKYDAMLPEIALAYAEGRVK